MPTNSPFREAALILYQSGLCPIPCGGEDGKFPLVATKKWRKRPSLAVVEAWIAAARFSGANIGILTGLSGVTVLDIDDPNHYEPLIALFGPTPLVIETPRGGFHLWYKASGERCCNLRNAGFDADIKGAGGFIVTPPSVRTAGANAGRLYTLTLGHWGDLSRLPAISAEGRRLLQEKIAYPKAVWATIQPSGKSVASVQRGTRNNDLFSKLLRVARGVESLDDLLQEANAWNNLISDPLGADEVAATARSAWRYEIEGRNFSVHGGISCSYKLVDMIGSPDAFWLFVRLMRVHNDKVASGTPFAISARAMAGANVLPGMGERRIIAARARLLKAGVLIEQHRGGYGPGDPSLYVLRRLDLAGQARSGDALSAGQDGEEYAASVTARCSIESTPPPPPCNHTVGGA